MKIDSYVFGSITVEGKMYDKDLIIFPDGVKPNWWRREGHFLSKEDIETILEYNPEILVIGKGAYGAMVIPEELKKVLKSKNIDLIDKNTAEASQVFNDCIKNGQNAVGAFHLTC